MKLIELYASDGEFFEPEEGSKIDTPVCGKGDHTRERYSRGNNVKKAKIIAARAKLAKKTVTDHTRETPEPEGAGSAIGIS